MLLSMMRKHAKSWLIKCLIAIIAVVFIFYFGYSFTARQGLKIAYVNGELISGMEYHKAYRDMLEGLQKQYKSVWNDNLIKVFDLKNRALENLISRKLIAGEARRLGLDVTEKEVQEAILSYPAFQIDGQFHMGRYQALLSNNRMKPEDFEAGMGQELLDAKVKQFLLAFMGVTDKEVLEHYTYGNERISISFVRFKADVYQKSIQADETSLQKHFDERREDYRVPEKIKLTYLEIDPKAFRDRVKVNNQEITGYYEYHMDKFSDPHQVRARHILFKLDRNATENEEKRAKDMAEGVLKEARQGKDFAALAGKYSEGPTKTDGGDLGYFSAGQMDKSFEDAAFKLKKGEISDLVRTNFGYHIIKVEDVKEAGTKAIEEVRDQIVEALIRNASADLAHEKGLTLLDQLPYDAELTEYAAEHDLKAKYTSYFSQDEQIPDIGGSPTLRKSLFALEKMEASELLELEEKFYLFQVAERKASYIPQMAEVAGEVKRDFVEYHAAKQARAAAETYLAELQNGSSWKELAKARDLEPEKSDFFSRQDPVPELGNSSLLKDIVFHLSENRRYPDEVYENGEDSFVIRWEESKGVDEKKYLEDKDKYRFSLMRAKHDGVFQNWLMNLRKRAEIEIVAPVDER